MTTLQSMWAKDDERAALRAEIERLRGALRDVIDRWATERGMDGAIQRARNLLLEHDLRSPAKEDLQRALEQGVPDECPDCGQSPPGCHHPTCRFPPEQEADK